MENSFDGLGKSRQIIDTRNQNIGYPTMVDAIQNRSLEFGILIFIDIHAQYIFSAFQIDTSDNIYCFLDDLSFTVDMIMNHI